MAEAEDVPRGTRRFWKIEAVIWADEDQVSDLGSDFERVLCPDPEHQPPCPIPWEIDWHPLEDTDPAVESLALQVAIEYPQ